MSSSDNRSLILQFCEVTGANTETAEQLLVATDNNMELAVQLYLEEVPHRSKLSNNTTSTNEQIENDNPPSSSSITTTTDSTISRNDLENNNNKSFDDLENKFTKEKKEKSGLDKNKRNPFQLEKKNEASSSSSSVKKLIDIDNNDNNDDDRKKGFEERVETSKRIESEREAKQKSCSILKGDASPSSRKRFIDIEEMEEAESGDHLESSSRSLSSHSLSIPSNLRPVVSNATREQPDMNPNPFNISEGIGSLASSFFSTIRSVSSRGTMAPESSESVETSVWETRPIQRGSPAFYSTEAFRDLNRESVFLSSLDPTSSMPSTASPASTSDRAQRLADLFRPPLDLIYRGSFEEARSLAKLQNKWILVNLQDSTEFSCQVLNRDLWSHAAVKSVVKESFVFLQLAAESQPGKRYVNYYPITGYPHISIIDPRTGERVKIWSHQISPSEFLQEITDFLEAHPLQFVHQPQGKEAVEVLELSDDDEELNKVIEASIKDAKVSTEEKCQRPFPELAAKENTEPDVNSVNMTRIQLRLADGSKIIRRFNKDDAVRDLFEFVLFKVPETQRNAFDLLIHNVPLSTKMNMSMADAGLQNALVTLNYL